MAWRRKGDVKKGIKGGGGGGGGETAGLTKNNTGGKISLDSKSLHD